MRRRDLLAMMASLPALSHANPRPKLSIIMDDLGYRERNSYAAIELPPALTVAILPHTQHSEALSQGAAAFGHEVMMHLPMEATNGKFLGVGGLTLDMDPATIKQRVDEAFASVPNATGFNNHMGSAFSQSPRGMAQLMAQGRQHANYYIDSLTHAGSIGEKMARLMGLKAATRDVFLDDDNDYLSIPQRLETLGRRKDDPTTIAICHPRAETIQVLQDQWSWLEDHFDLVSPSQIVV